MLASAIVASMSVGICLGVMIPGEHAPVALLSAVVAGMSFAVIR